MSQVDLKNVILWDQYWATRDSNSEFSFELRWCHWLEVVLILLGDFDGLFFLCNFLPTLHLSNFAPVCYRTLETESPGSSTSVTRICFLISIFWMICNWYILSFTNLSPHSPLSTCEMVGCTKFYSGFSGFSRHRRGTILCKIIFILSIWDPDVSLSFDHLLSKFQRPIHHWVLDSIGLLAKELAKVQARVTPICCNYRLEAATCGNIDWIGWSVAILQRYVACIYSEWSP